MTPISSANSEDQVHRTRIFSPCLVMPVGQPKRKSRSTSVVVQAVSDSISAPLIRASRARRTQRLPRTSYRPFQPANPSGRAYWTACAGPGRGAATRQTSPPRGATQASVASRCRAADVGAVRTWILGGVCGLIGFLSAGTGTAHRQRGADRGLAASRCATAARTRAACGPMTTP